MTNVTASGHVTVEPLGDENLASSRILRIALLWAGTLFLAIGIVGIAVPVLPTTPFLLLTAGCYARGSRRFYNWFINNRLFGKFLLDYREGRGIPFWVKFGTVFLLWTGLAVSAILMSDAWVSLVLFIIGIGVSVHIAMLKSQKEG